MNAKIYKNHARHSKRCDAGTRRETLGESRLMVSGIYCTGLECKKQCSISAGDLSLVMDPASLRELHNRLAEVLARYDADELTRKRIV